MKVRDSDVSFLFLDYYQQINKQLSDNGVLQAKIIVTASNTGPTLCYLATTDMTMRYQTATNSIVYGNLSRKLTVILLTRLI